MSAKAKRERRRFAITFFVEVFADAIPDKDSVGFLGAVEDMVADAFDTGCDAMRAGEGCDIADSYTFIAKEES